MDISIDDNTLKPRGKKCTPYRAEDIFQLQILYICATIFWIFVAWFVVPPKFHIGFLWLLLPLIIFTISYYSLESLSKETEYEVFQFNYLSAGLLVALPLLAWAASDYAGDRRQFIKVIMTGLIFALLSILDIWTADKWITLTRHMRSIFQTYAIILLIFALHQYWVNSS